MIGPNGTVIRRCGSSAIVFRCSRMPCIHYVILFVIAVGDTDNNSMKLSMSSFG